MSGQTKDKIAIWLTFLIGTAVLVTQVYNYFIGVIDLNAKELTVTIVAVVLIFSPKLLVNMARSYSNSKTNDKTDGQ